MAETTTHRIEIPSAWLQAIRLFADKTDLRDYMKGVAITHGYLVATDGSVIGAIRDRRFDGIPETIIPGGAIGVVLTVGNKRKDGNVTVQYERTESATGGVFGKGTMSLDNVQWPFTLVEGRYPDIRRALKPDHKEPNGHPQFNLTQLALFGKAAEAMGAGKGNPYKVHLIPDEDRAARVKLPCEPSFEGCLMPLKASFVAKHAVFP